MNKHTLNTLKFCGYSVIVASVFSIIAIVVFIVSLIVAVVSLSYIPLLYTAGATILFFGCVIKVNVANGILHHAVMNFTEDTGNEIDNLITQINNDQR